MIIVAITAWNDFTIAVVPRRFVGTALGQSNWRIGFWFLKKPEEAFHAKAGCKNFQLRGGEYCGNCGYHLSEHE